MADRRKGKVTEGLKNYKRKDQSERFSGTPYAFRPKFTQGNSSDNHGGPTVCSRCGKSHPGVRCDGQLITCYYCHEPGHVKRFCPKLVGAPNAFERTPVPQQQDRTLPLAPQRARGGGRSGQKGHINVMTRGQVVENQGDVMTGTFLVNYLPVVILFDSGASLSFISSRCAKRLELDSRVEVSVEIRLPS
ncbi:uncharacterized protein LOC127244443 [Andrographis paniculata]|uniref:uncharacterized protein LOC127244443 n=1 Tax=Andrographis paniculata TaxID=175694 RepID=UPI0021E73278|nr:uncharacterized protein LOC127244443 [Andrographis paniculata]